MAVLLSNEQDIPVDEKLVRRIAERALQFEGVPPEAELSVALVNAEEMRRLNEAYRGIPEPTDVLSFPMDEGLVSRDGQPRLLGDVVISPEVARDRAEAAGYSFPAYLGLLLVHGVLHLLGYDHLTPEEAEEMEARERELLRPFFGSAFEG